MRHPSRRHLLRLAPLALLLSLAGGSQAVLAQSLAHHHLQTGKVFSSSNADSGNALMVYDRTAGGGLRELGQVATGGLGLGHGLGSQGAVSLSTDGRFVFVVNALSNTVSTFEITDDELSLRSVVDTGGLTPISVTEHDGLVVVLNSGGDGNIVALRNQDGVLSLIDGSQRDLSAPGGVGPAQVSFSTDAQTLVVTEKASNRLSSYSVDTDGSIGQAIVTASPGQTPFGFAFNRNNRLIVSEAIGGAPGASTVSSYRFKDKQGAQPLVVSAAVPDTQGAACWVAVTPNGRYAYVANTGSSSVSSFKVAHSGAISLVQAVAGSTGAGSSPADSAVSANGRHLYVRSGGTATISSFRIAPDGSLSAEAALGSLPASAYGLAAN
jgi:6-phosphogluconolactonase (cycloisomerase 2 family)